MSSSKPQAQHWNRQLCVPCVSTTDRRARLKPLQRRRPLPRAKRSPPKRRLRHRRLLLHNLPLQNLPHRRQQRALRKPRPPSRVLLSLQPPSRQVSKRLKVRTTLARHVLLRLVPALVRVARVRVTTRMRPAKACLDRVVPVARAPVLVPARALVVAVRRAATIARHVAIPTVQVALVRVVTVPVVVIARTPA